MKKISALYTANWRILFWLSYTTFLIWPLFRGYGRNPGKNFIVFLGDLKTPKGHFEINWPLVYVHIYIYIPLENFTFVDKSSMIDHCVQNICFSLQCHNYAVIFFYIFILRENSHCAKLRPGLDFPPFNRLCL